MNESKANNKITEFSNFCRSKNCPEYIEWDCGEGMCQSCKLVGQSYYVNEYPKDCLHLKDITLYESGKLVLPIHDVSKRFTNFCGLHQFMDGHETCPTCIGLNE